MGSTATSLPCGVMSCAYGNTFKGDSTFKVICNIGSSRHPPDMISIPMISGIMAVGTGGGAIALSMFCQPKNKWVENNNR